MLSVLKTRKNHNLFSAQYKDASAFYIKYTKRLSSLLEFGRFVFGRDTMHVFGRDAMHVFGGDAIHVFGGDAIHVFGGDAMHCVSTEYMNATFIHPNRSF